MLEILDPRQTDSYAHAVFLPEFRAVTGSFPGGWNYIVDYTWVAMQMERMNLGPGLNVVEIGGGTGVMKYYIEYKYGVNVCGIDRDKMWERSPIKADAIGDFCDKKVRESVGVVPESIDLIFAISAFEHNKFKDHKKVVAACMESLRPGGVLVSTVSTHWDGTESDEQYNLTQVQLEEIYQDKFEDYNWEKVHQAWWLHFALHMAYNKRYGKEAGSNFDFLPVGVVVKKEQ